MAWIEPERILILASAVAMLAIGLAVLAIDFSKRANRAFGALMAARAVSLGLAQIGVEPRLVRWALDVQPYVYLSLIPLACYFASVYPLRRGPLGRTGGGWVTLGIVAVLDVAYFLRHDLYHRLAPGPGPSPLLGVRGLHYEAFGPFIVLTMAVTVVFSALAVLFARDYTRSTMGSQRTSYFLVAAGFIVNGLFDGSRLFVGLVDYLQSPAGFPLLPWGWAVVFLPSLGLPLAVAALALIAIHHFPERRKEKSAEFRLYAFSIMALATGLLPLVLPPGSDLFASPVLLVILGAWRLALPSLVAFALMRYALFDLDVKLRSAVAGTVAAAIFGVLYFTISQIVENVVSERYNNLVGFGLAAVLAVTAERMLSAGRKVASLMMPETQDVSALRQDHAAETYRQEFLFMQEDGVVTRKERRALDILRERLGIAAGKARAIETTAIGTARRTRSPKPAPPTMDA